MPTQSSPEFTAPAVVEILKEVTTADHVWSQGVLGHLICVVDEDLLEVALPIPGGALCKVHVSVDDLRILRSGR